MNARSLVTLNSCRAAAVLSLAALSAPSRIRQEPLVEREIIVTEQTGDAINKAIQEVSSSGLGGVIKLLTGRTYETSSPVVIDKSNITLVGNGATIKLKAGTNLPPFVIGVLDTVNGVTTEIVKKVKVINLKVNANGEQQQSEIYGGDHNADKDDLKWTSPTSGKTHNICHIRNNAFTVRGAEDVELVRVEGFNSSSGGLTLEKGVHRIKVSFCNFYNNKFDGIAIYETHDSSFYATTCTDHPGAGISIDWNRNGNVTFDKCTAQRNSLGVFARHCSQFTFIDCNFENNREHSVFIAQQNDNRQTPATELKFQDCNFSHGTNGGDHSYAIRIANDTCTGNLFINSSFKVLNKSSVSSLASGNTFTGSYEKTVPEVVSTSALSSGLR